MGLPVVWREIECLEDKSLSYKYLSIQGGWLLRYHAGNDSFGMLFIKDLSHDCEPIGYINNIYNAELAKKNKK